MSRCDVCLEEAPAERVSGTCAEDLLYLLEDQTSSSLSLCQPCAETVATSAQFVRSARTACACLTSSSVVTPQWAQAGDADAADSSDDDKPLQGLRSARVGTPPIGFQENDTATRASEMEYRKEGRRVVETTEYKVIRLTLEQVRSEMEERAGRERFQTARYRCDSCVMTFNFEDVLQKHQQRHEPRAGYSQCVVCGQYCPSPVSLRGHIKSHSTRYECKVCGAVRRCRQHLSEHYASEHRAAPARYTCETCGYTGQRRTMFQKHVRSHMPRPPVQCSTCHKNFRNVETLRVHRLRHTGVRPARAAPATATHYCVECDTRFATRSGLRAHLRKSRPHRHTAAETHECEVCHKTFGGVASLRAHAEWAHQGRRKFACPTCNKRYGTRDGLRAHERTTHSSHALTPPAAHPCHYCNKTFKTRGVLVKHERVHTGERPYECSECGNKFAQNGTLATHVRLVHRKMARKVHPPTMPPDVKQDVVQNHPMNRAIISTYMQT